MSAPVQAGAVGTLLAAGFAAALVALLLWMLRVPRPVSIEVARAVHSVGAVRTILVPILEAYYSERAVELASRLGQLQKATILLGYVVEVPRTLSLGVPLPGVEQDAARALEQAKTIVAMHGLEAQGEVVRAREAAEGIARVARDHDVDLIVLGISPGSGLAEGSTGRIAEALLRQAPCEVIIDRLTEGGARASGSEAAEGVPGAAPRGHPEAAEPGARVASGGPGRPPSTQEAPPRPV